MGMLFNGAPKPPNIPVPPPAAHPATLGSSMLALTGNNSKAGGAAAEGMGQNDTVQTSPQGLVNPATAKATLLGG
jgi:hypothetical protein